MFDNHTLWMLLLGILIGILRSLFSSPESNETDEASAAGFLVACLLCFEDEE